MREKNIISALIEEHDIRSAKDIQDALRDLLGGTIEAMLKAEMDEHLGCKPFKRTDNANSRNGKKNHFALNHIP